MKLNSELLRKKFSATGLSREAYCGLIDTSISTFQKMLKDQQLPRVETLAKMAEVHGNEMNQWLVWEPGDKPQRALQKAS